MLRSNVLSQGIVVGLLYLAAGVFGAATGSAEAHASEGEQRYPYDPVCPWGRLADGRGMLVRCMKQDEVLALTSAPSLAGKSDQPLKEDTNKVTPASDASTTDKAPVPAPPVQPTVAPAKEITVQSVGPAVVDSGELPLAVKKLSEPKDRYLDCVRKNGGLQADSAEVLIRFLVRERGRAEGVSVAKRKGMTEEAARCIADVVDRRYVGYPAAPIVGATLPIVIAYKGK